MVGYLSREGNPEAAGCYLRDVKVQRVISGYLLSLPERVLRSATALAGGIIREVGEVALPVALRRTRLYSTMVDSTLRFLIEQVGDVPDAYPGEEKLAENFLVRRGVGNGIEAVGILAFRASPVWVLAALADLSGAGRHLIGEIARTLQDQGLLDPQSRFETVDQMLDGLESTSARLTETINTPPLNVADLRRDWETLRESAKRIPPQNLPSIDRLERQWRDLNETAAGSGRSAWEVSALLTLSAIRELPAGVVWLTRCAGHAVQTTGEVLAGTLLDHYSDSIAAIRREGFLAYWLREFRPYLRAAARHFSPGKQSLTERLFSNRLGR
jgi:hypothetical protein